MQKSWFKKILVIWMIILLIGVVVFPSTAITAEKERQIEKSDNKIINPKPSESNIETSHETILFSQLPFEPNDDFNMYISDKSWGMRVHDNYSNVSENISLIRWWGLSLYWNGSGWKDCNPVATCFEIIFWDDLLGNKICEKIIRPGATPTGTFYNGFEMYKWEASLDPCLQWPDGWVSIQNIQSPYECTFFWMGSPEGDLYSHQQGNLSNPDKDTDVAFEITDAPTPALCCKAGILDWVEVKPNSTVYGTFYVWNCGENDSILKWYIDSYSPWMNNIEFSHTSGNLTGGDSELVVHFNFTAPNIEYWEFYGYIQILNFGDNQDNVVLKTHLITPKNKDEFFNFLEVLERYPLLNRLFYLIK